ERLGAAGVGGGIAQVRPLLLREVGGQLDAVAVGIRQVDRLGDAVVGRALDRRASGGQPHGRAGELEARGVEEGEVVEPGVAAGGQCARLLDEDEHVLAARAHRGGAVLAAVQPQADRALVEVDRAVEVADGDVHRAEPGGGGQRGGGGRGGRGHDRNYSCAIN